MNASFFKCCRETLLAYWRQTINYKWACWFSPWQNSFFAKKMSNFDSITSVVEQNTWTSSTVIKHVHARNKANIIRIFSTQKPIKIHVPISCCVVTSFDNKNSMSDFQLKMIFEKLRAAKSSAICAHAIRSSEQIRIPNNQAWKSGLFESCLISMSKYTNRICLKIMN